MKSIKMLLVLIFLLIIFHGKQSAQNHSGGIELFPSGYDYSYNNSSLKTLNLVDTDWDGHLDPTMIGIHLLSKGGKKNILFAFSQFGIIDFFYLYKYNGTYTSPSFEYCEVGPYAEDFLALASKPDTLRWVGFDLSWIPLNQYSFITQLSSTSSSFIYLNDSTIWLSTGDLKIYKSTDAGANFLHYITIGDGDPNFGTPSVSPAELPIHSSSNGQFISVVGAFEGAYLTGNPDIVYWYYSTDYGVTWQGEAIGRGSGNNPEYGQVINRDYAPYFTNFAQGNAVVDDIGVTHVVFNGYGEGILPGAIDTTQVFPVLYWNSNYKEWKAITDPEKEAPDDGHGHSIIEYYPGNAIGNSYPTVSVSADGMRVLVIWTGPEYTGYTNDPYHIFPGDGGPHSTAVYYTDLYVAASYNGGNEIGGGIPAFETQYNIAEMYPYLADRIIIEMPNHQEYTYFVFFNDSIPGVSIFNENSFAVGNWNFGIEAFYFPSVEPEETIGSYYLSQNYPNPFNPITKIRFTIPNVGTTFMKFVQLKVYDVLGNEVATLVNEELPAGEYEVEFNIQSNSSFRLVRNLSSSIYFYQLRTKTFTQTKKMILMK